MNEIMDFYQQQAKARISTIPWLAQLQSEALEDLARLGFPNRHNEEWKYTLVDGLLKQNFTLPSQVTEFCVSKHHEVPAPQCLFLHNGFLLNETINGLPAGVLILPLALAMTTHEDLVRPYLGTIAPKDHAFQALNTAMLHLGLFIYMPKGVCIEEPIALIHTQDHNQAIHLRHLIIVEEESTLTLIEHYSGEQDNCYFTNTVTELFAAVRADVTHYKVQQESKSAYHVGHLAVKQSAESKFSSHSLSLGGKLVRSDISMHLQEEYAQCLMNGIYAPSEGQHIDHHTTVHHSVPHCSSEQDYKGILNGHSRAVFNGKVIVAKDAQHTNAKQQNKNLLLSAHAEINTKPQLEIFADDVLCSHGATVGQLDEDALFFLATRGIGRLEAAHYLIHAFAQDNLRLIPNRELADWMSHLLTQQLG